MKKIHGIAPLVLVFVFAYPICVSAEMPLRALVKGKYSFNGQQVCVSTPYGGYNQPAPDGFDDDYVLKVEATIATTFANGMLYLSSDGTGTAEGVSMSIHHGNRAVGDRPISVWEFICEVSYEGLSSSSIRISFVDCAGPIKVGAQWPGDWFGSYGESIMKMSISGDVLLSSDQEPDVETGTYKLYANNNEYKMEQVCTRTFTAIRSW